MKRPLTDLERELLAALRGLYEHCSMIHKYWGDGNNATEAKLAIEAGQKAIARAEAHS